MRDYTIRKMNRMLEDFELYYKKTDHVFKPQRISILAGIAPSFFDFHSSKSKDKFYEDKVNHPLGSDKVPYDVPLPHIRFLQSKAIDTAYVMEMSGDGDRWVPAYFPHIYDGNFTGCIQSGESIQFDEDNPLAIIFSHSISYIFVDVRDFYDDLISAEIYCPCGGSFCRDYNPHQWMQELENKSIEEMCNHIKSATRKVLEVDLEKA